MSKALRILNYIAIILVSGSIFTACFDDYDYEEVNYNDLIVSNVQFGTLSRIMHTKNKAGGDSTYNSTVSATTAYPFTIDHVNNMVYNLDSLPYGTRADKIIFSTFSVKDGATTVKSLTTGEDTIYATADTLDFSRGYREFSLYGSDGTSRRVYRVEVRIHKQTPDSLTWSQHTLDEWNAQSLSLGHTTADFSAAGLSFRLADGVMLAAGADGNYAPDAIDNDDTPFLPTGNLAWISATSRNSKDLTEVFLYGTREHNGQLVSTLWRRNVDRTGVADMPWEYLPATPENLNPAPALHNATLLPYDKGYLLVGLNLAGGIVVKFSLDRGRTWKAHEYLVLPSSLKGRVATSLQAGIDDHSNLWLLIDGAEVWRGRAHSVDWAEVRRVFED